MRLPGWLRRLVERPGAVSERVDVAERLAPYDQRQQTTGAAGVWVVTPPFWCGCEHVQEDGATAWVDVRVTAEGCRLQLDDAGARAPYPCTTHPGVRCTECGEVRDILLGPDPRWTHGWPL